MASTALFSKLKILVAKLYKAEQLYSSMRRIHTTESSNKTKIEKNTVNQKFKNLPGSKVTSLKTQNSSDLNLAGQSLIEFSNDIRSNEWYKVHHSFRIKLNDILIEGYNNSLNVRLNDLWQEFLAEFEVAELDLEECNQAAKDSLLKEEYSYLFKLSSELIRRKARLQALKIIHDELNNLISHLNTKQNVNDYKHNFLNLNEALNHANSMSSGIMASDSSFDDNSFDDIYASTNVIPLRRKVAN